MIPSMHHRLIGVPDQAVYLPACLPACVFENGRGEDANTPLFSQMPLAEPGTAEGREADP